VLLAGGDLEWIGPHDARVTPRLDELLRHCADLGIEVEWPLDLPPRRRGEYRWWCDRIALDYRLTDVQAASSLAHELGHRVFGDRCSTPTVERRADEYAAALLVTPDEYRAAEEHVGHHIGALAVELGVTTRLVIAWRRWWETRGQFLPPETLRRLPVSHSREGWRECLGDGSEGESGGVGRTELGIREQVGVGVDGGLDRLVAKPGLHDVDRDALAE
jgi:hypothetical protein